MTATVGTSIRLETGVLKRADALISVLELVPELSAMGILTRSKVLRLALARGLADLERDYGSARRTKKAERKDR